MKQLITLTLLLGLIFGCKKETLPEPINPLTNTNWRYQWINLTEFKLDTMFEYNSDSDMIITSTYRVIGDSIHINNKYKWILLRDIKDTVDIHYSVHFEISNDTLYFNGIFKGIKY